VKHAAHRTRPVECRRGSAYHLDAVDVLACDRDEIRDVETDRRQLGIPAVREHQHRRRVGASRPSHLERVLHQPFRRVVHTRQLANLLEWIEAKVSDNGVALDDGSRSGGIELGLLATRSRHHHPVHRHANRGQPNV
jgi:hypothetical protein